MNADLVKAARWLGGSILLGCTIVAASLCWVHRDRPIAPTITGPTPASNLAKPIKKDELVSSAGLEVSLPDPDSPKIPIIDQPANGSDGISCMDPPSEEEVWDKLTRSQPRASPVIQRNNARIVIEKIGEKADLPKVYPLAGLCQLVHCHYKCTVYFDELNQSDSPIPVNHTKARVEVVFIDKDHLQRCGGAQTSSPSASTAKP